MSRKCVWVGKYIIINSRLKVSVTNEWNLQKMSSNKYFNNYVSLSSAIASDIDLVSIEPCLYDSSHICARTASNAAGFRRRQIIKETTFRICHNTPDAYSTLHRKGLLDGIMAGGPFGPFSRLDPNRKALFPLYCRRGKWFCCVSIFVSEDVLYSVIRVVDVYRVRLGENTFAAN